MTSPSLQSLRQDIGGGLVSAAVAIPLSIGFGMFAFVTLGDEYFAHGALAGLISAFVAGIVCVALGERATMVYAPRITTTFFIGLLLYSLTHSEVPDLKAAPVAFTLLVLFAIMLLAGLFQALFGLMKLGTLIKFAPHPVMAGFQNMAAVLLFLVQLGNVLGYDRNVPFTSVLGQLGAAKPLSVLVAAITFAAMWHARRITTKVPPLLVGLSIGLVVYYVLMLTGLSAALGPTIGTLSASATVPRPYEALTDTAFFGQLVRLAPVIVPGALALALIAAIDAMLCAKLASRPGDARGDSNALLVRLGLANAASAMAGGITSGINIGASVTNRAFGGHSWVSVAVNAALLLATILVFPLLGHLPRAVLSAVIMVVAIQHIDPWSKQATAKLFRTGAAPKRDIALDLGVALVVSILSIAVNIVLAVFLGVVLAVSLFVLRMSRSNIRRLYRCDTVRSRKARGLGEMVSLEVMGGQILAIELQGALFFGSAERLAQIIDTETARGASTLILDLRRVTEIDSTGLRILADTDADLLRKKIRLAFVLAERGEIGERVAELPGRRFPDIDRAIEWAEDELLNAMPGSTARHSDAVPELPLEKVSLLRGFTPDQMARLRPHLARQVWPAGSTIFREGDAGSHLFLVTRGRASVRLASEGGDIRLATFAPGTVFGELALLDRGPRSATVTADDEVSAFALSVDGFETLRAKEPDLAILVLSALGRELSGRLRQANRTIHQLEA
ncbi:MAG: sulfate transporter [Xanthobacteraceae bacterium]|nr:sulfate transporter [Xanthobacteraceae bacterium]